MDIYESFLRLAAFSDEDIARQLPMWKKACIRLGLSERDVKYAVEEWIPEYWDLSLLGIRKCIGAYIHELIELCRFADYKARGDKIIYCNMPSHPACAYANKISGGDRMHVSTPDFVIASVLNAFFHKSTILNHGDIPCMNPMCNHCGMNRLHADAHYKQTVITPTVMWNWGLCCNEGPKTEELIQCMGEDEWHYVFSHLPHDALLGVNEASDDSRVTYLAKQLEYSQKQITEFTGIAVTEEQISEALDAYLYYVDKLEQLCDLVTYSDPQPITSNELTLFGAVTHSAFETGFKYVDDAIDTMLEEVKARVAEGRGVLPKDSPKLACHFTPYCVPWVNKAFIDNRVNLTINTLYAPASYLKKYHDKTDIYRTIAQQWLCNPSAVNMMDEVEIVTSMLSKMPLDGVLYGFFEFDRWIGGIQKTMIKIVEERTGIPHYYLEGDFWNDDKYSLEDRISRIQSIAYKVRLNHMVTGWKYAKNQDTEG